MVRILHSAWRTPFVIGLWAVLGGLGILEFKLINPGAHIPWPRTVLGWLFWFIVGPALFLAWVVASWDQSRSARLEMGPR